MVKDMIELLKSWENIVYFCLLKVYRQTDKWKCLERGWGLTEKRDRRGRKGIREYSDTLSNTITIYHVHIYMKLLNHKRKPFIKKSPNENVLYMKFIWKWVDCQSRCTLGTPRMVLYSLYQILTSEFYSIT